MLVMFDIDGVLVNIDHRLKYLRNKDYDRFYSTEELSKDTIIRNGDNLLKAMRNEDVYFVTSRPERCRKDTEKFLEALCSLDGVKFSGDRLYMRSNGDFRPSSVVKPGLVEKLMKNVEKDPFFTSDAHGVFIDDMYENIKAVRRKFPTIAGLTFDATEIKSTEGKVSIV